MLTSIAYSPGRLKLLDQRRLPNEQVYLELTSLEDVAVAIEGMVVRGAPAIASAALFALAIDAHNSKVSAQNGRWKDYKGQFGESLKRLRRTRPTAVNLFNVLGGVAQLSESFAGDLPISEIADFLDAKARAYFDADLKRNQLIGSLGAELIQQNLNKGPRQTGEAGDPLTILTHCNTGSLATGGYGTALGVIRYLFSIGRLKMVYVDETRPWLQGARLTAFELQYENIPFKLIADSAAAFAMKRGGVDAIIVGADRIAANGDTANKIGTYQLAVSARYHGLGFYVAASVDTIDLSLGSGDLTAIEERPDAELRRMGSIWLSPEHAPVWNPSFDVTPAELITGIITERGVVSFPYSGGLQELGKKSADHF